MNSSSLFLEFAPASLKVLNGDGGLELPLERQPDGRLTPACRETVTLTLRNFLKRKGWRLRVRALCAIGARGVALRRLSLPAAANDEFQRLLPLQIESEFPLPPDELAWGYKRLGDPRPGNGAKQQLLVAAIKKEIIEDYSDILLACGVSPVFTLASLARNSLCPESQASYAVLDVTGDQAELACFEDGAPVTVRTFSCDGMLPPPVGGRSAPVARATQAQGRGMPLERGQPVADAPLESLAGAIRRNWTGTKLYLSGNGPRDFAASLAGQLGGVDCEPLAVSAGEGCSAATLGLRKLAANGGWPSLTLAVKAQNGSPASARPTPRKWAALAVLLLAGVCVWPYAEACLFRPRLARKLSAIKADKGRLAVIDRELGFLQFLKQNQPPYLDALYIFSKAAPPGMRLDSVSMNRHGELSLRGSAKDGQQVADFRSKLIESGFFSTVSVEEQTPTPDRQKVNLRLTAQWKPVEARALLAIGPTPQEIEKTKTNKGGQ
jgi:hypothetical protein